MIFYNFIFILVLFSFIFSKKQNEKILYFFIAFLFFILSFIRWEVGTDWNMYFNTFYVGSIEKMYSVKEIGFRVLNYIVYKIFPSYTLMLFFLAVILFIFKYTTLYKLSYVPLLSLLMAFCLEKGDIFFVRQSIAIAITFYSTKYIIKKEKLKFILCIVLASFIHKSSFIFIFAYFVFNKFNLRRRHYCLLIIFSFVLYIYGREILSFFIINLPDNPYKQKLLYYFSNDATGGYKSYMSKELIFLSSLINRLFLISVFFIFWKKIDIYMKKLFSIYFISFLGFVCVFRISQDISRLTLPYEVFQLVIFPSIYKNIKSKETKIIFILIAILYLYLKLLSGLSSWPEAFIPYNTIFNS